ncbi:bifunctional phosphoglucose/phosphomannose isomerase [Patescibacteria group bacterium]|nr:bifunctional phosphoglucose/phosphomannose isomerase [Patescibacteria group bacterium]
MLNLRKQFDKENLHEIISDLPRQFSDAFENTKIKIQIPEKIIFCAVGGSALPVNLLKTFLAVEHLNFEIPLKINRDYTIPPQVNNDWSGFFISYSGNSEETLSALAEAEKKNLKEIIIIAHGGKLKKIAEEKNYPFIEIPDFHQPRMSYAYVIGALLKTFDNSGLIKLDFEKLNEDIEKSIELTSKNEAFGLALAEKTKNRIPIFYASNIWKYIGMVLKININENAKQPAFWNVFPEMNHNEMVGFTNGMTNFKVIIIKDPDDDPRNIKRMEVFREILGEKLEAEIIEMPDASNFFKMIDTLSIGQWMSYYLALLNEVDPTPVEIVERFKKLL